MKITKPGCDPNLRKWVGRCHRCGAEATATRGEMTRVVDDQRDGQSSWEVCPACGAGDKTTGYGGMIFYPAKGGAS